MHLPSYEIIEKADDFSEYKFISTGPNGDILKILSFDKIFIDSLYNLSLVDQLPNGTMSDTHFSNNNDIRKIMATIVEAMIDYTNNFPDRMIFFQGSDEEGRRISLYQRAISNYLFILEKEFDIYGIRNDGTEEKFVSGQEYGAILAKRK